jgi:hypothetical protein
LQESSWTEYAIHLASTGIDGLELNFYNTIVNPDKAPEAIEKERIEALKKGKKGGEDSGGRKAKPLLHQPHAHYSGKWTMRAPTALCSSTSFSSPTSTLSNAK